MISLDKIVNLQKHPIIHEKKYIKVRLIIGQIIIIF